MKQKKGRDQFTISVSRELITQMRVDALKQGRLFSDIIEQIFLEYLSRGGSRCKCAAQGKKLATSDTQLLRDVQEFAGKVNDSNGR